MGHSEVTQHAGDPLHAAPVQLRNVRNVRAGYWSSHDTSTLSWSHHVEEHNIRVNVQAIGSTEAASTLRFMVLRPPVL